nr:immunoglobulin heavy chain junction region [Mus musculus]MBK4189898.1 immunoglobulin heavy chain junction region [Mus musculus]MBK4196575.1 immunoglobulin heavy chain junction region [Mus musculus]MBK4196586.1 immunoglobulin heavy chain junction region [Mus musculus]MBK4196587.1 immunoglobulin heavy chain junction region [Mus musculus]
CAYYYGSTYWYFDVW